MRVHIGSDHAGFELKNHLVGVLTGDGHEVVDHGPDHLDPEDDYPTYCIPAAQGAVGDEGSLGIVIGGSGNGEAIAANKVHGVRAALAWSEETASLGREHNNANVISIGARMHTPDEATRFVEVFITTAFTNEERHIRRINMMSEYEKTGTLPALPGAEG